ncbi:molybdopterin-dependent oxidoreductase [Microbacterium terricola]|uniref:Oxidoreductase n=1 Tax=Microbacterium terricola TaxID=344163 RepID=A0ABM8E2R2_9MICO|nr:molybdopterin-dependent oxidoreductase [Microbacterium terricola]UYK40240.1 molybdopterin-dependent oxidoreductase [Microbacterium terricola]BDV32050.1 oxidoreductase [Microbacterium terricola]
MRERGTVVLPAVAGVASVALGAGIGELVAALFVPSASPVAVIGGALIDAAPSWAKDAAIALFGTADKIALVVGIALVLVVVAGGAGVLEVRRPPWGSLVLGLLGAVGAVVALTRADAGGMAWLPSAVAGLVAAFTLRALARLMPRAQADSGPLVERGREAPETKRPDSGPLVERGREAPETKRPDRRAFLGWTIAAAAAGALSAIAASALQAGRQAASAVRDAITLPRPSATAPPVPAGAELGVDGLAPLITPNEQFYRIDTALIVPSVATQDWSLRIHGMVEREVTLTWDELLALPLEESTTTLACVSNTVGGDLIGNALWLGYPIRELLARAVPSADADMVLSRSIDGFTASTPLEVLTDDRAAILAVGMNGEPLPAEHGFPVRMVVPGLYGYVSATKWVTELEVTRFDATTAYWTTRGWSERGPIKLQSRIDVPRPGAQVAAGDTVIAGVAWQQHVGVAGVEVQIDEGSWQAATLATAISDDTWVQWSLPWTPESGDHTIRCRALSADGTTQTADTAPPAPDGATGHHTIHVTVA